MIHAQEPVTSRCTVHIGRPHVLLALVGVFAVAGSLAAQDLGQYRDIPLGATLADVITRTRSEPAAVSNLHIRP